MRVLGIVASLALSLASPAGALAQAHPSAPIAQPGAAASASAASPGPRAGLPPAPPLFSSAARFGDHLWSVRWELALIGGAVLAIGIRDWDWGGSDFQFIEEGWFSKNTRHGGMDKIGHAFSTFVIADILTERIRESATDPAGAPLSGRLSPSRS